MVMPGESISLEQIPALRCNEQVLAGHSTRYKTVTVRTISWVTQFQAILRITRFRIGKRRDEPVAKWKYEPKSSNQKRYSYRHQLCRNRHEGQGGIPYRQVAAGRRRYDGTDSYCSHYETTIISRGHSEMSRWTHCLSST